MADRDYYEVLGVKRDASADQIKKAYRGLARKHHPDANPGDKTAEAKFKEVQNAYDILSEPEKKTRYDQYGHAGFEGFGPNGPRSGASEWAARAGAGGGGGPGQNMDFSQFFNVRPGAGPVEEEQGGGIFDEILTRMRGDRSSKRKPQNRVPEAAEAAITIPFLTAVRGGETTIELEREGGRRETKVVRIPPGLESGAKLRLKGQGDPSGSIDLILSVSVDPHPYFTRNGRDLAVEVPITVSEAILGAKVDVPTLNGSKSLPIPAGTSGGRRLKVRGQGVPASKTAPDGDLYLVIKVVVPPTVDDESRQLIEQFSARNPSDPRQGLW